jgi:hypothetical protein
MIDTTDLAGGLKEIAISHNSNIMLQDLVAAVRHDENQLRRTAWCCVRCQQVNAGYAKTCGRCENI